MNWLDAVLIVLVLLCGAVGMWTGLIRAAFGALGVALGILVAGRLSDNVSSLYASHIANETVANVIAYGLIILLSVILARVLAIVVRKAVYMMFMGWTDRAAGLAMGLVAGVAISWAAIVGLAEVAYNPDLIDKAVSAGGLEDRANLVQVKRGLDSALIDSVVVGIFVEAANKLPAEALGFGLVVHAIIFIPPIVIAVMVFGSWRFKSRAA